MIFLTLALKSQKYFFRKIIRVPPMKIEKNFYPNWAGMCSYDHISSTKPISRGLNTYMAKP